MNEELLSSRIAQSLADALETIAFVMTDAIPADCAPPLSAMRISLAFSGPMSGVVELIAPEQLGMLMVSNIFTDAAEFSALSAQDALKELLNVTCGSMLRSATDQKTNFDMSLPQVSQFDVPAQWETFVSDPHTALLDAEGSPIAIRVKKS